MRDSIWVGRDARRYGYVVAIFSWWSKEPVFHGYKLDDLGVRFQPDEDGWVRDRVRCGRVASEWQREGDGRVSNYVEMVPAYHAARIGRPCRRCFR